MNKQETKAAKIRQWLMSGKPLTQWEATKIFRYLDLAALVYKMRRKGISIKTDMLTSKDGVRYARYQVVTR